MVITGFFMLCISPFCLVFIMAGMSKLTSLSSFFATYSLALVNSCIQPFIFVYLNSPLREDIVSRIFNRKT